MTRDFPQLDRLTVRIGASLLAAGDLPMDIIDRANEALSHAEANGRNQVHLYEDLVADGKLSVVRRELPIQIF